MHEFLGDASHVRARAADAPRRSMRGRLDAVHQCDFRSERGTEICTFVFFIIFYNFDFHLVLNDFTDKKITLKRISK